MEPTFFYPYPRIENIRELCQIIAEEDKGEMEWRKPNTSMTTLLINPLYRDDVLPIVNNALANGLSFNRIDFLEDPEDIKDCCLYARLEVSDARCYDSTCLKENTSLWDAQVTINRTEDKLLVANYCVENTEPRSIYTRKAIATIHIKKGAEEKCSWTVELVESEEEARVLDEINKIISGIKEWYEKKQSIDSSEKEARKKELDDRDFTAIAKLSKQNEYAVKAMYESLVAQLKKAVSLTLLNGGYQAMGEKIKAAFSHPVFAIQDDPNKYGYYLKQILESDNAKIFFKKIKKTKGITLYRNPFASWFTQTDDRIWGLYPAQSMVLQILSMTDKKINETCEKTNKTNKDNNRSAFHAMLVEDDSGQCLMDKYQKELEALVNRGMTANNEIEYTERGPLELPNDIKYSRPYDLCYLFLLMIRNEISGNKNPGLMLTKNLNFKNTADMLEFYKDLGKTIAKKKLEVFWSGKIDLKFNGNAWTIAARQEVQKLYHLLTDEGSKERWGELATDENTSKDNFVKMILFHQLPERSKDNLKRFGTPFLTEKEQRKAVMSGIKDEHIRLLLVYDIYRTYRVAGKKEEMYDLLSQEPELKAWVEKFEPLQEERVLMTDPEEAWRAEVEESLMEGY